MAASFVLPTIWAHVCYWQLLLVIIIISAASMEISGVTDMVQLRLLIGNFQWQLPDRISHISFAVSQNIHSPFNLPHAMSPEIGASIFDEALAFIVQRI